MRGQVVHVGVGDGELVTEAACLSEDLVGRGAHKPAETLVILEQGMRVVATFLPGDRPRSC
jgi:hypothetical protein